MKRRARAMTASGFLIMVGSVACDKGPMQHSRVRTSRRPHARVQSRTMPTQRPEFQIEYRLLESRSGWAVERRRSVVRPKLHDVLPANVRYLTLAIMTAAFAEPVPSRTPAGGANGASI